MLLLRWMHRDERYGKSLAMPDITIADLVGEVDPIKVAEGRYLSDELHDSLWPLAGGLIAASSPSTNCRISRSAFKWAS